MKRKLFKDKKDKMRQIFYKLVIKLLDAAFQTVFSKSKFNKIKNNVNKNKM